MRECDVPGEFCGVPPRHAGGTSRARTDTTRCFFPGRGQVPPDSIEPSPRAAWCSRQSHARHLGVCKVGQHLRPGYQTQAGPGHTLSGPRRQAPLQHTLCSRASLPSLLRWNEDADGNATLGVGVTWCLALGHYFCPVISAFEPRFPPTTTRPLLHPSFHRPPARDLGQDHRAWQ